MSDEFNPISDPVEPLFETPVAIEEPKTAKVRKISVKLLSPRQFDVDGVKHFLVISVEDELRGFLIPVDSIEYDMAQVQKIDPNKFIEIYNWGSEIENMIPDREEIKRNILLSFWRAGGISLDSLTDNQTRRKLLSTAFPYKLEEN